MRLWKPWRYPANLALFGSDDRILLILFGILVGALSGLAAVGLNRSLIAMLEWLRPFRHHWWAFVLPAAGAALSALFLSKIMKEGAGHGVPEVIYSVSRYGGLMRLRSIFSRLISSCLTIGSGGSAGPEAPVVMSGAAIGSNIATFFALNDRQRVTLVGCGAAGAISSIFNAPIAGMVFTIEIILGEWTALRIIPIAIASVAGTEVSRFLQGNQIPFGHRQFNIDLLDTVACVGLAVMCAAGSVLLTRTLREMGRFTKKVHLSLWAKAAIGGGIVGAIGLFVPVVLGEGYHAVQTAIEGSFRQGLALAAFAALAKLIATTFTLGWGGSGGIFAPCLVIGCFAGLTYHRLLVFFWPTVTWVNEGCYALLGMAGLISGMLQAPLTGIFLILEITGGYEVMLPLIIVSAISTTLCHTIEPASFYMAAPESAETHARQLAEQCGCTPIFLKPRNYTASTLPDIPTEFDYMCCPRSISDLSSKIGLGYIGPRVRRIVKSARFPVLVTSPVFKPWTRVTVFFGGSVNALKAFRLGLRISRAAKVPMTMFTHSEKGGRSDYEQVIRDAGLAKELDSDVQEWLFYEQGKFEENLYDVPHDALVVLGAYGHGVIRDIVFGSKMEKTQSTISNNMLIVGPNYAAGF